MGYYGSHHFDAYAFRTENYAGIKDFARGCMRTYLILKEKARQWNQDKDIQALLEEVNSDQDGATPLLGPYSAERVRKIMETSFDRASIGKRGFMYEVVDQLTIGNIIGCTLNHKGIIKWHQTINFYWELMFQLPAPRH